MSDIVGSAIQGIANIGSTLFGINSAKKQQQREQAFNAEQAQINRDFQTSERQAVQEYELNMWNRNNEYNSLSSQLQRAREAGVSPNAILGGSYNPFQSTQLTSTPMSGATASAPGSIAPSMLNAYASLGTNTANMLKTMSEKANIDEQTAYNKMSQAERIRLLKNNADNVFKNTQLADVNHREKEELLRWISRFKTEELNQLKDRGSIIKNELKMSKEKLTQEEYLAQQAKLKKQFSEDFGITYDATELELLFRGLETDAFDTFVDNVIEYAGLAAEELQEFGNDVWEEGKKAYYNTRVQVGNLKNRVKSNFRKWFK